MRGRHPSDALCSAPLCCAAQVYEGLTFKLSLYFPSDYPFTAPVVKFEAPGCFHPNVDLQHGHICLDVLKEKWSAVHNIRTILLSIQSLLGGAWATRERSCCSVGTLGLCLGATTQCLLTSSGL